MANLPILLPYYNEIRNSTFLTKEEEYDLLYKAQSGDTKARDIIIKANLLYVTKVAKKMANNPEREPDLIQAGNIGLIKAIKDFQFKKDCRFITYALFFIKGEIYKEIGDNMRTIRIPDNKQVLLKRGHITEEQLPRTSSLDNVDPNDYNNSNISPDINQKDLNKKIKKRVSKLIDECVPKQRDKEVLKMRFGIGISEQEDSKMARLQEIATKYNISRQLVDNIIKSSIKKIKRKTTKEQLQSLLYLISDE